MKKIYLSLVLSIVSVISVLAQTSAQTNDKPTGKIDAAENVKVGSGNTETGIDPVKTIGKTLQTDSPQEQKPQAAKSQKPQAADEQKAESQKTEAAENQKNATIEPVKKTETIETVKKTETDQPKPAVSEDAGKPEALILETRTSSLGGLTTGNAEVDGYIEEFCALFNVDPLLIYAQMSQESSFRARAVSPKGASGFMQLMPDTARRFGVTNVYSPKQNIKAGVKYMRWLLDKFGGDQRLALAGYNAGEGAVMKYGNKIPPYRETQNYVAKIMIHYERIIDQNSTLAQGDK